MASNSAGHGNIHASLASSPSLPLIPAVDRVPEEVFSMIFEQIVLTWQERPHPEYGSKWPELWSDTHTINLVSRRWRRAALHTPILWTNLWHGDRPPPWRGFQLRYDYRTCLELSAASSTLPIRIHADGLLFFMEMIRDLAAAGALDRVTSILIIGDDLNDTKDGYSLPDLAEDVRKAAICPNVNELGLEYLPSDALIDILRQYTMVKSLKIGATRFEDGCPFIKEEDVPVFADLKRLEVYGSVRMESAYPFKLFSAPAIERLDIHPDDGIFGEQPYEYLMELESHGGWLCLAELTYGGTPNVDDLLDLFRQTPNLKTLNLIRLEKYADEPSTYDDLLDALSVARRNESADEQNLHAKETLLPHLETFTLCDVPISFTALNRLVDARITLRCPIQHIGLAEEYFDQRDPKAFSQEAMSDLNVKVNIFSFCECDAVGGSVVRERLAERA